MHQASKVLSQPDFLKLWIGETISDLGSFIGTPAIRFGAVVMLAATPFQMGLLSAVAICSGLIMSFLAGVCADRARRRPLMLLADWGRAAILLSIPLAALQGTLTMLQLYAICFAVPALDALFRVSYNAYLPTLVGRDALLGANSKLAASAAVAEVLGYAVAGWLVEWLTAPAAVALDAVSFLVSALAVWSIGKAEILPYASAPRWALDDIVAGARFILCDRRLLVLATSIALQMLCDGAISALYLLFVMKDLGFEPGALGMIFAVGGVSSLLGAVAAQRAATRFGVTPTMTTAVIVASIGLVFIPMAQGSHTVSLVMLIAHQLITDGAVAIFMIVSGSFVQSVTPDIVLGRVTASMMCLNHIGTLVGALLGGTVGGKIGIRVILVFAAVGVFAAGLLLKTIAAPLGTLANAERE